MVCIEAKAAITLLDPITISICPPPSPMAHTGDLCVDIGKHKGAEQAVRCLYDYPDHPKVRQQALWFLSELVHHGGLFPD